MLVNNINFTIGADPEIFLGSNGKFVSAHDKLPGDKLNPFRVEKGAVQVDGMAAEFNIDPAEDFESFKSNLDAVQNTLKEMTEGFDLLEDSSVFFDEEFMKNIPQENLVLGCSSDFNGWTMQENQPPNQALKMRTAGGHIHIGGFETEEPFNPVHFNSCARLARILDRTIGVYSVLWDKDDKRREMYGKAGSFRPKKYGMEYRTLSNSWLFDESRVKIVYEGVFDALSHMFNPDYEPEACVQDIINKSDRENEYFIGDKKAEELGFNVNA